MTCFHYWLSCFIGFLLYTSKPSVSVSFSLQQENKELKATVAELQSALEAERRRVAALEICLRNAERSRDEALRRNKELQRDIQQFLTLKPQAPT